MIPRPATPEVPKPAKKRKSTEAERRSEAIDEEIRKDALIRNAQKKREVKVMLLGQAASGKSTLQKQFQLHYASQTLSRELPSWRPVVYFNIVKALRMILDELDYELSSLPQTTITPAITYSSATTSSFAPVGMGVMTSGTEIDLDVPREIAALRARLLPLVALEDMLASELNNGVHVTGNRPGLFVRSGWQALVTPPKWSLAGTFTSSSNSNSSAAAAATERQKRVEELSDMVSSTMYERLEEAITLWRHRAVRILIQNRRLTLDESAPFFLDQMERIAQPDYMPTFNDILSVRLQTLGVKEHSFDINLTGSVYRWLMYDVGGARGQRHVWIPYFADATAIIFLAPISAFDQYLEEDPRTNRIDDSLQLFKAITSNKLLKSAHLVVLLNKIDLLKQKLDAGIKVRKFITSYGDRPNTFEEVSEYFRAHFIQTHKRNDIGNRKLFLSYTSMLDVNAMQGIVASVGEAIIRQHIAQIGLLS